MSLKVNEKKYNLADEKKTNRMTHAKRLNNDQIRNRNFFIHEAILWWSAKAQAGLHIRGDSPESSLFACKYTKHGSWKRFRPNMKYLMRCTKTYFDFPSFYKYFLYRSPLNVKAQLTRWTKGLILGWSLHLRPYFVRTANALTRLRIYAQIESSLFTYAIILHLRLGLLFVEYRLVFGSWVGVLGRIFYA